MQQAQDAKPGAPNYPRVPNARSVWLSGIYPAPKEQGVGGSMETLLFEWEGPGKPLLAESAWEQYHIIYNSQL